MWYKNAEEFKGQNGYEINSIWYPRVTKILEVKAKPGLQNFFKEVGNYASAEEVKQKSAEHGTIVHNTVQKLAIGAQIIVSSEVRPAAEAFQEFTQRRKMFFYPEFIESRIWSMRHRYAGTVDALVEIDGRFGVLDIKTSTGFYPEYNLQTAAYVSALQEFQVRKDLKLPREIQSRWILRVNQHKICGQCKATMREKGGWTKVRAARKTVGVKEGRVLKEFCQESEHEWGGVVGDVELKEFPYLFNDTRAFMAAKILWEWDNNYWLRQIGYLK